MQENDADTVDFGGQAVADTDTGSDGHGMKSPGYMEAPAQAGAADTEEAAGAARPHIGEVAEG